MTRSRLVPRFVRAVLALMLVACAAPVAAAPGDVYWSVNVNQRYHYYVFLSDWAFWDNTTVADTALDYAHARDTSDVLGTIHISNDVHASEGHLTIASNTEMTLSARVGVFHQTYDDVTLDAYVKGPTGTPFVATIARDGLLQASRVGGLPGTLQPLNGSVTSTFADSTVTVPNGGSIDVPISDRQVIAGTSTTAINVNGETYSLALHRVYSAFGSISQALCILGCMAEAANFHSLSDALVTIDLFPNAQLDVPVADANDALVLAPLRNPVRGAAAIEFGAPTGRPVRVEVFDAAGRRVATPFDGVAGTGPQHATWNPGDRPAGLYFVRLTSGRDSAARRIVLVR